MKIIPLGSTMEKVKQTHKEKGPRRGEGRSGGKSRPKLKRGIDREGRGRGQVAVLQWAPTRDCVEKETDYRRSDWESRGREQRVPESPRKSKKREHFLRKNERGGKSFGGSVEKSYVLEVPQSEKLG